MAARIKKKKTRDFRASNRLCWQQLERPHSVSILLSQNACSKKLFPEFEPSEHWIRIRDTFN